MAKKQELNLYNILFTGRDPWDRDIDDATTFRGATRVGNDRRTHGFRPHGALRGPLWRVWLARQLVYGLPICPPFWLTVLAVTGIAAWGWSPWTLLAAPIYLLSILTAAAVLGVRYLRKLWETRQVYRDIIWPTAKTVARITGTKVGWTGARRMVQVPDNHGAKRAPDVPAEPIRIALPVGVPYTATMQRQIESAVAATTGTPNAEAEFHISKRAPYVLISPTLMPPTDIGYADIERHLNETTLSRILVGLGPGRRPIFWDYDNDSPHCLISGPPGSGKSTLVKFIEAQRMMHGAGVVGLDDKLISHLWMWQPTLLPSVLYAGDIEPIHNASLKVQRELVARKRALAGGAIQAMTIDVVIEEANFLMIQLAKYWKKEVKEPGDSDVTEAVDALQDITYRGRELLLHAVWIGQRLEAYCFGARGGASVRNAVQNRALTDWGKPEWNMFGLGLPFQRCLRQGGGHWIDIKRRGAEQFQVPLLTNEEARR